ncbi:hypothetical protein E1176_10795 [Fulvivirga sp. RKSG066]|uniref:hypothetical protein n=1 Tax=Fulvivirga aurantia TaxID=2529383 RepID=UPI0012BCC801|nr:hypothetical protein [Fulvivirga aurantia]MTI21506.1 hypothetical protein [Fulvivirga aurantia]
MKYPLIKPKFYIGLFNELILFIKAPSNSPNHDKSNKEKVYDTIGLFILKMILLIPVMAFLLLFTIPKMYKVPI